MLIISKFKDYYDYLQGIYGIDKKRVLDRTSITNSYVQEYISVENKESLFHHPEEILYFCGDVYKLYCKADYEYLWGRDKDLKYDRQYGWISRDSFKIVYENDTIVWIKNNEPSKEISKVNFPYFVKDGTIPVLKHIYFDKVLPSDECYRQIEQFISYKEPEPDSDPTNMNRYESKGFDKKTSFRKM